MFCLHIFFNFQLSIYYLANWNFRNFVKPSTQGISSFTNIKQKNHKNDIKHKLVGFFLDRNKKQFY